MNLLLDTHVLLWWVMNSPGLSREARRAIADPEASVFVSSASVWEITINQSLGKLDSPSDLQAQMERHRFDPLPITFAHAAAAGGLPLHHRDLFDRMLVAQAVAEDLTLVTRDRWISLYGVPTLRA